MEWGADPVGTGRTRRDRQDPQDPRTRPDPTGPDRTLRDPDRTPRGPGRPAGPEEARRDRPDPRQQPTILHRPGHRRNAISGSHEDGGQPATAGSRDPRMRRSLGALVAGGAARRSAGAKAPDAEPPDARAPLAGGTNRRRHQSPEHRSPRRRAPAHHSLTAPGAGRTIRRPHRAPARAQPRVRESWVAGSEPTAGESRGGGSGRRRAVAGVVGEAKVGWRRFSVRTRSAISSRTGLGALEPR
jgi:hypothetical protein